MAKLLHGASKHTWRTQAAWANTSDGGEGQGVGLDEIEVMVCKVVILKGLIDQPRESQVAKKIKNFRKRTDPGPLGLRWLLLSRCRLNFFL